MRVKLTIWRQKNPASQGKFVSYPVEVENGEMSMLELLDVLNEALIEKGEDPVAFDHDCREGICGMCGFMINGVARQGSSVMASPSLKLRMWSWQLVVPRRGPCGLPFTTIPHIPQMPSRQSWSKAIGSSAFSMRRWFTTSSISRKDMSGLMSGASYVTNFPSDFASFCRQTVSVSLTCSSSG